MIGRGKSRRISGAFAKSRSAVPAPRRVNFMYTTQQIIGCWRRQDFRGLSVYTGFPRLMRTCRFCETLTSFPSLTDSSLYSMMCERRLGAITVRDRLHSGFGAISSSRAPPVLHVTLPRNNDHEISCT
jgi:hypothetical protein